jgi:hypothetical protein
MNMRAPFVLRHSLFACHEALLLTYTLLPAPCLLLLARERFFVHDVWHLCRVSAVISFEHVNQSLHRAPGHAFVRIDI